LYSGEQFDSKIGQQYLRARYYDPATGRFNCLDPFFGNLDASQSLHKYLYTHADPVSGIDPTGKFLISLGIGIFNSTVLRNSDTKASIGALRSIHWTLPYIARTYDFMFTLLTGLSMFGSIVTYSTQGILAGNLATFYCIRGLVEATGIGLLYTHLSHGDNLNGWEFSDDGTVSKKIMERDFRRKRYLGFSNLQVISLLQNQ
jgi:RHS repeat-associated protein